MKYLKDVFYILLFLFVFLIIQAVVMLVLGDKVILSSVISSVLTLLVFVLLRWAPFSRDYVRSRPWTAMCWVVILALGTIIPSTWLGEQIPYDMPEELNAMLTDMMHNRWGYLALGILAPLVEEMVFRGAILRVLLKMFDSRWYWVPIVISALLFGAVHGNLQQFVHASLIGLILGWMYYRTDSIVPGVLFHWVNNSAAYAISNLIPGSDDAKLVDLFGGNQQAVWMALGFSCCLIFPALFQLYLRLKKNEEAAPDVS